MDYDALLDGLLDQIKAYNTVHRKSIQPFTKSKISKHFPDYQDDFDHEIIRESLLEHVGCLPVIATYLHPYMDETVDLGKSLMMIAIHDIGELTVGDELTFIKTSEQGASEYEAAMMLLHDNYKDLYKEMDDLHSNEAKFVKSIDKMAPDIFDYLCGEDYSIRRMVLQAGWTAESAMINVRAKKRPYMEWSQFLTTFHDRLFYRFESIIKGVFP
jgi:5'-deoxynucleotidase YfbR-like HD superfamily hydrolase